MLIHVHEVRVVGPYQLHLVFSDGMAKTVDVRPLLTGLVFEPLHDHDFFNKVELDPICKTIVWPNGADIAPEALHELMPHTESTAL